MLGVLPIVLEIEEARFHHTVYIVKGLHHAFILGLDFLRDNNAHIDFETNTLHAKTLMLSLMLYVRWILMLG